MHIIGFESTIGTRTDIS